MSMKVGIDPDEWFRQARYDLKSADVMFANKQYIHAVFMCHLAVEKALKGLYVHKQKDMPPRTHNLVFLAQKSGVVIPEDRFEFLATMNNVSVPTRYPDELNRMRKVYTKAKTEGLLAQCKELVKWLKSRS